MAKPRKTKNFVFYQGPSALDGVRIVAIATFKSANGKTGSGLVQTWLMRADIPPIEASRRGLDSSVCGSCKHMGVHDSEGNPIPKTRTCYVTLRNAPRSVWACFARGGYASLDQAMTQARFAGCKVRLGSYGDPAAVPYAVWQTILEDTVGHTGYTHQWAAFPEMARWCMASVDNLAEMAAAKMLGFRTFRVGNALLWRKERSEALCGASKEAGYKLTCDACMACGGRSAKPRCDIVIPAHGAAGLRVAG